MQAATAKQPEQLLTPEEVADLLRFSRRYIYELINRGEFGEVVRLGYKATRITRTGYDAYVERKRGPRGLHTP